MADFERIGEPDWLKEARKRQSDYGSRMCPEEDSYEEVIAAALYRIEALLLDMASAAFSAEPWEGGRGEQEMKRFWDAFFSAFVIDFVLARRERGRYKYRDGIAGDWRAVGNDLRRAMGMMG